MSSLLILKSMLYASAVQDTKKKKKSKQKKSGNKDLDKNKCRLCYEQKGKISIFNNEETIIAEELKNFADITINETDDLPKSICQTCLDLFNGCIQFRNLCRTTNSKLIELSIKKEEERKAPTVANPQNSDDDLYNPPSPAFSDNSPLWGCSICKKEFLYLKTYNKHLSQCKQGREEKITITEEHSKPNKSFLCDICGKVAKSNASLLVHMGVHENVFPFKCDECPYQGRTMDLLRVHKRSHLTDKPFKCTQCNKATTTSSNLKKHMRHVHSTTRPHKCSFCERAFSYQHDVKRHIRDTHLRQGTVQCDVCNKKFNTKKILQGHRWKIHKIKGERLGRIPKYLQCQSEDNENNLNNIPQELPTYSEDSRIVLWEGLEQKI